MKTAVIYNSQTGFTEKYAKWIAEALNADCFDLRLIKKYNLELYDTVVFGSWACAGRISKLSWVQSAMEKYPEKAFFVFCTGGSPAESLEIASFLSNQLSEEQQKKSPLFYCPDGFNYEKMSSGSKMMMKLFRKMLSNKKDKTQSEIEMLKMISRSYDISDRKYIEPIVNKVRDKR